VADADPNGRTATTDRVPIPAGQTVDLAPGGDHMMLIDLNRPLDAGER
jgi:copper(I)-binding protein